MDLNIVPSEFTKEWIVKTKFDKTNEETKEKVGEFRACHPPLAELEPGRRSLDEWFLGSGRGCVRGSFFNGDPSVRDGNLPRDVTF